MLYLDTCTRHGHTVKGQSQHYISLSGGMQADIIDAFNTTFRYLDDFININNIFKSNKFFRAST